MVSILFERPLPLIGMLVVVLAVLYGVWNRRRTARAQRALLAGVCAAPLLLCLQAWVVTDRERLIHITGQISSRVEAGDVAGIMELFDPHAVFAGGQDLQDFEDHLRDLLDRYQIREPRVGGFSLTVSGDQATVRCRAFCRLSTNRGDFPLRSSWQLGFRRVAARWRITDLAPISIMDRLCTSFFDIE